MYFMFMVCKKTGSIHINIALMCLYHHCCLGKAISIAYSEHVPVALVVQHAKCVHCVILSSVACLAVSFFFLHHLISGTIFRKKSY